MQIAEASHLLVFAAHTNIDQHLIDDFMARTAAVRSTPVEQLADFKNTLETYLLARTPEENFQWSSRQAYIGLGIACWIKKWFPKCPRFGFPLFIWFVQNSIPYRIVHIDGLTGRTSILPEPNIWIDVFSHVFSTFTR